MTGLIGNYGVFLLAVIASLPKVDTACEGHYEGEQWNEGSCKVCFCYKERITCGSTCGRGKAISDALKKKPSPDDKNTMLSSALSNTKDSCFHDNKQRQHEESWIENSVHASTVKVGQECMLCHCNRRIVSCTIRVCPPVTCQNPIRNKGSCCQYCPEHHVQLSNSKGCSSFGSLFEQRSNWKVYVPKNGKNECLSCLCQKTGCKSSLTCQRMVCPIPTCAEEELIYRPGQCCKTCKGNQKEIQPEQLSLSSSSGSSSFFDALKGSTSGTASNDGCGVEGEQIKTNVNKKLAVTSLNVEKVKITNTKHQKDPKDCDFGGIYKHGESFIPEQFKCHRCTCRDSNVTCGKVFCPVTHSCSKPETRDGVCCKVCPELSTEEALKLEERDVRPLTKRRKACSRISKREERIQVYEYQSPSSLLGGMIINKYFLFDRSQMTPPGQSEIHFLKFRSPNHVTISVDQSNGPASSDVEANKWKYIGSIKSKILERIHRHEKNIRITHSSYKFKNLINLIKEKAAKGKSHQRGARCERKSNEDEEDNVFASQKLFKKLKEIK